MLQHAPNLLIFISFIIGIVYFFYDKDVPKGILWRAFFTSFFAFPIGYLLSYPIEYLFTLFPNLFYFYDPTQQTRFGHWLPTTIGYYTFCFLCIRYILIKKFRCKSYLSWFFYGLLASSFHSINLIIISFMFMYAIVGLFGK